LKSDRRVLAARLGAHPERRVLLPLRRAALRRGLGRSFAAAHGGRAPHRSVVLPPVVNMYARADPHAPVVSQATLGTTVLVAQRRGGWALAETPDRYRGWIRAGALAAHLPGGPFAEVASLLANIYTERDVTARAPIAVLPMLARVEVLLPHHPARGRRDALIRGSLWVHPFDRGGGFEDWLPIRLPDGRSGWAQRADLRPVVDPQMNADRPADVIATARRFLGLPYLWGGTTPFGLDCSGMVQLAHRVFGITLPRDADLQWADRRLAPVPRTRLRPGDLVFFGPRRGAVTHVGLALGRGAFISATTRSRPEVRVDSLSDPYWKRLYRGARRTTCPRDCGDRP
jgi:cell wall-associated NlpC family hydrolase